MARWSRDLAVPEGDPEHIGGLWQRQAQVVVKDDDRALLGIQVTHATRQVVPVSRERLAIAHGERGDLGERDLDASPPRLAQLIAAGVQEEPVEPGFEAIGVAKGREVPPAADHRLLDGLVRTVGIAQDERGCRLQPAHRGACEYGEGVMIALPRSFHEVPLHVPPRLRRADLVALGLYGDRAAGIVPKSAVRGRGRLRSASRRRG